MEQGWNIKPEFIAELALAIRDPHELAKKHGYTEEELLRFYTYPWFNKAVADKKEEFEKAGFNFQAKMKMLAEDMIIDAYQAAKLSTAVTPKLDVAKHLTKIAGLEPQPTQNPNGSTNPNFSITIALPKEYIDSLHDRNTPKEITLQSENYHQVSDTDDHAIEGTPPELDTLPALVNKDLT